MRNIFLYFLKFYQKYLTLLSFGCCRYYPTCSEYAKWQFLHNSTIKAFYFTIIRILKCNPYFKGGIDYPLISLYLKTKNLAFVKQEKIFILFWFVPFDANYFYIVKAIFDPLENKEN